MDRMVIQHTTKNNRRNQRQRSVLQQQSVPTNSNVVPVDPFTEITDFVHQLYKELVAQNQPHAFNDFSCVFCDAAYLQLSHLIDHLESVHRHQVLTGTFQLQPNFEELIRSRILQGIHQQPIGLLDQSAQPIKMESLAQAPPGHMYQCAKCYATFGQMDEVTQHVAQCAMPSYGYQQQQQQHQPQVQQQTHHLPVQQPQHQQQPLDHHQHHQHTQQHQTQHSYVHKHHHQQSSGSVIQQQQQHHQQHYQQPQQQPLSVPIVETPTTVPIRHKIYGCARCGLRFRVVRELVLHLHTCVHDTFHDKAQYLTPDLWLQAPEGQHIVINEPESNTTLNTTGLWLMSNDVVSSPDIVSKGFWVMPPNPNEQDVPNTPIKSETITSAVATPQSIGAHGSPMSIPYDNFQMAQQPAATPPAQREVHPNPEPPVQWKKQIAPRKPSVRLAEENKRKREGRAKASGKNINGFNAQPSEATSSGVGIAQQQQHHQSQLANNKYMYMNGDEGTGLGAEQESMHVPQHPPPTKRKRYEQQQQQQQQIVQDYLQTGTSTELIDLNSTQSYIINEYDSHSTPSNAANANHQTQHIITKDGLLYEQLDYDYSAAAILQDQTPIKIESNEIIDTQSPPVKSTPKSTHQQHFKKKMQRSAAASAKSSRSNFPIKAEVIDEVEVDETPPQILAIIADPEDLEDLSHLDAPIVPERQVHALNAKQSDYISSYCSFLKNRTHK